jgi:hypothetical protein
MRARLLHSVIDEVLEAAEQWPEFASDILHFVFDDAHAIRKGLYETTTHVLGDGRVKYVKYQGDCPDPRAIAVIKTTVATDCLVQFAHAVSRGFIPHVMAAGGGLREQ